MPIKIGDRVSYADVLALGKVIVKGGTGTVIDIKPDPYGKTSRKIAIVRSNRRKKFEIFVSALHTVGRGE